MANISHFTQTVNGISTTYDIHDAGAVPLAGTNALSGSIIPSTNNTYNLGDSSYNYASVYAYNFPTFTRAMSPSDSTDIFLIAGTDIFYGAYLQLSPKDATSGSTAGGFRLSARSANNQSDLIGIPDGTLTWNGQAIQTVSDQRFKQQISEIDDKLLDAWEDVELVQFKYNDAVGQKKDKARLHTGYVVQQIDNACKEHGVDISEYGLYCHEEYPEETEEVEVEQADGTKTKETKVIREASEHYSLRYTEVYAVECMYLRRCIARLTARIEELEKGNDTK